MKGYRLESLFWRNRVKKDLDKLPNCWYARIENRVGRGDGDVFLCINGKFVMLELKKSLKDAMQERKGQRLQKRKIQQVKERALGEAYLVYPENWSAILSNLEAL